jgi:hypothetical protein
MRAALLAIVLAACGGDSRGGDDSFPDANPGECAVYITFEPVPDPATAGPNSTVRADAHYSGVTGIPGFSWHVRYGGGEVSFTNAQGNASAIVFPTLDAGIYDVQLDLQTSVLCPSADTPINVLPAGSTMRSFRLRVVANRRRSRTSPCRRARRPTRSGRTA